MSSTSEPSGTAACHCGRPVYIHEDLDGFTRGLCQECDETRCDAPVEGESYPCRRRRKPVGTVERVALMCRD